MTDSARLPVARLLLVGVLVPAVFAAVDHWLLSGVAINPGDDVRIGLTMAAFVVQVAVMGMLCGRLLVDLWWRWGLYLWGWLLIDLQVFAALGLVTGVSNWWNSEYLLIASLLAAQAALAIIWGILGSTRWTVRWPLCSAATVLLSIPLINTWGLASELFPVGVGGLVALCLALRWQGYRLDLANRRAGNGATTAPGQQSLQFGVRHVLIWTTSLAVVLGVLRGLDLLHANILQPFLRGSMVTLTTAGILVAALFIVALWAALGEGPAWLRWPVLVLATVLVGFVCAVLEFVDRGGKVVNLFVYTIAWDYFWADDGWIMAWMALAGGLLAAALLILRTIGYRLVQVRRRQSLS